MAVAVAEERAGATAQEPGRVVVSAKGAVRGFSSGRTDRVGAQGAVGRGRAAPLPRHHLRARQVARTQLAKGLVSGAGLGTTVKFLGAKSSHGGLIRITPGAR